MEQEKNPDPFLIQIAYKCFWSLKIIFRVNKYILFLKITKHLRSKRNMSSCDLLISKSTIDESEEIKNGIILDSNNPWRLYSLEFLLLQESVVECDSIGRI